MIITFFSCKQNTSNEANEVIKTDNAGILIRYLPKYTAVIKLNKIVKLTINIYIFII